VIDKLPVLRSAQSIVVALALLFAAVFFLPYLAPVTPVVSISYVVGYSNRAAFFLFAVGSVIFAFLVRERLPVCDAADQRLGAPSLFAASAIALFFCCRRLLPFKQHIVGDEAGYALNRIQMLVSGHKPYLGFEYGYGPAHLYLPVLFSHFTHGSIVRGYYVWWIAQWLGGTAMLWLAVRWLDLPLRRRRILFWLLFLLQLPGILNEGTAYTPTRTVGAAFFVIVVASLWNPRRKAMPTIVVGLFCVLAAFAISPEQGIAVFAGLLLWFIGLAADDASQFTAIAAALFACGGFILTAICWRLGEFTTLIAFSAGAYSFPLLPSPTNAVILSAYLASACVGVRALLTRRLDSVVVPLFFTGFALLPAAMGRCDAGHLMAAAPILLLGTASVEGWRSVRRWWSPLAIVFVVLPIPTISLYLRHLLHQKQLLGVSSPASAPRPGAAFFADASGACPIIYRTFNVEPEPDRTSTQDCLDTGRYYRMINALTPQAVDAVIADLYRQPRQPLLLLNDSLEHQLQPLDIDLVALLALEVSPWVPRIRNPPFTYRKLIDAIERDYRPAPAPTGPFRVWYPKAAPPA